MPELADYSGKFDPGFSHDKFSKETLIRLLKAYSEYMLRIDGFWYLTVMDKWGNDEALDSDIKIWEKCKLYEMRTISTLLNIQGDDVATVMKYLQVYPFVWNWEYIIDLKNNNHAIYTQRSCTTLFALEREGKGRERQECHLVCQKVFNLDAHFFNPDIKVTGLKVPPRADYKDVACQWEFKLEK